MIQTQFPHVDLSISLKAGRYEIRELYNLLSVIKTYELGGGYDTVAGFKIDVETTWYDDDSDRPYTILDFEYKTDIVWHSHPFGIEVNNAYPSIEDINTARLNPHLTFMILTGKGVYVISVKEDVSEDEVIDLYNTIDDDEVEMNFVTNRYFSLNKRIFIYCIPISVVLFDKNPTATINRIIKDSC